MFRRKEDTIAPDPVSPANLKELGFFVNELGHIRMIGAPEKEYVFHATNNDRMNELRREAVQECSRQETEKRLSKLGINRIYLPDFITKKPDGPHVPILSPSPDILKTRKRIVVLVNDATQDLGILAYRQLQRDLGLNGATVVNFVKKLVKRSAASDRATKYDNIFDDGFSLDHNDTPALLVLNTGQLLYSHKHNKAMTMRSWSAMPRRSVAHDMIRIHEEENRVHGHQDPKEHVKSVFDSVLCNSDRVAPDAEIYVIAIEGGTEYILQLLGEDFERYGPRITGMALVHSLIDDSQVKDPRVRTFLHQRSREWRFSDLSADAQHCIELPEGYSSRTGSAETTAAKHVDWSEQASETGPLATVTHALHHLVVAATHSSKEETSLPTTDTASDWSSGQAAICPTFAGGHEYAGECVFTNPNVQHAILSFFEEVAQDPEHYRNPSMQVYTSAPQPTPDNPLMLDPAAGDGQVSILPPEMTPEQAELDEAKEKLARMKSALKACPENVLELHQGRQKLVEKLKNQQVEVEKLQKKALACGGLKADEAPQQRENWKPQTEGPKVKFAGAEFDSELLKAAGLLDTAEEALATISNASN
ncbi:Arb2 domain-containing protein [Phaeosphaeria sp. MPI-PUGE-AT-0046c]|nr:Arb2 domain-containing protein [Phaeosphaeria sp. MPI-PUGE-AT-0046c]